MTATIHVNIVGSTTATVHTCQNPNRPISKRAVILAAGFESLQSAPLCLNRAPDRLNYRSLSSKPFRSLSLLVSLSLCFGAFTRSSDQISTPWLLHWDPLMRPVSIAALSFLLRFICTSPLDADFGELFRVSLVNFVNFHWFYDLRVLFNFIRLVFEVLYAL